MSNGQKDKLLFAVPAGRQASIIALVVIHTAGIIGIHSSYRDLFLILSPLNLIICISLLFLNHKKFTQPFALFCVIVFAGGFLIEVIGVKTGIIFGNYSYGNTLGIQFLGVPLIIGINWLMLIYCVGIICNRFYNSSNLLKSMFGAIMMVFLDFFIEPVAIKYDFWSWTKIVICRQPDPIGRNARPMIEAVGETLRIGRKRQYIANQHGAAGEMLDLRLACAKRGLADGCVSRRRLQHSLPSRVGSRCGGIAPSREIVILDNILVGLAPGASVRRSWRLHGILAADL